MKPEFACFACHGLLIGQPVDQLASWINDNTPKGIHFEIVGGADPQIEEGTIIKRVLDAIHTGHDIVFIGHSKGAMLAYYLADLLAITTPDYKPPLFVSIDPVCWSSNRGARPWTLVSGPGAGKWTAPLNVQRFINFRQVGYPGGGKMVNALPPSREDYFLPTESHLSIPTSAYVRDKIRMAVIDAWHQHGGK